MALSALSQANSQQIQQVSQQPQAEEAKPVSSAAPVQAPAVTASDDWEAPVTGAPPMSLESAQEGTPILSGNNSAQLWGAGAVSRPPMFRHLDYFDQNKDGTLTIPEMYQGLRDMGASQATAAKLAVGTAVVRGSMTQGRPSLSINIENAFKSAQSGRSGAFDEQGNLDPKIVDDLLGRVDPTGKGVITMDDFKRAGKQMAQERAPGHGVGDFLKRQLISKESDLAWNSLMEIAGKKGADGKPYVTRDDIKWFFDGSLFYRLAADHKAA